MQLLNIILNTNKNKISHDYENENENENQDEVESEKDILSEKENEYISKTTLSTPLGNIINDKSDIFDSLKSEECSFPLTELDMDDYLATEIFGFGANKKVNNISSHFLI